MIRKADVPQHIVDAALAAAAERGWRELSLADVAARANLPLTEVYGHFRSKTDILAAYMDRLDEAVLRTDPEAAGEATRDRLFDAVMRRIEAMNPHKQGVSAILRDYGGDPYALACGGLRFLRSMALLLEAAGISASGLGGMARADGMAAVYLYTLRTWLNDDSPDMARTMAALDKALRRAEAVAAVLWRRRGPAPAAEPRPQPPP